MKKRLAAQITGRVQLVMYRDFACRNARRLNLTGTVENKNDGSVEVVAEGEEENLQQFLLKLKEGSLLSRVDNVSSVWGTPENSFTNFKIL